MLSHIAHAEHSYFCLMKLVIKFIVFEIIDNFKVRNTGVSDIVFLQKGVHFTVHSNMFSQIGLHITTLPNIEF